MSELKHSLVLPAPVVHEITCKLLKRNASKFYFERFDGDEYKTKFWLEDRDGSKVLMSQYPGRSFQQEVQTPEEMFQEQDVKPTSLKGALIEVFKRLGCSVNQSFDNAMNLYGSHIKHASPVAEKLVNLFTEMAKQEISPKELQILPSGAIVLAVAESDHDRFQALQDSIGFQSMSRSSASQEEVSEDPAV